MKILDLQSPFLSDPPPYGARATYGGGPLGRWSWIRSRHNCIKKLVPSQIYSVDGRETRHNFT
jgi:hypothetical protein